MGNGMLHLEVETDGSKQEYVEFAEGDEHIRVTFIRANKAGYQRDSLRIQIRNAEGHLRQGPEIPIDRMACLLGAIGLLVAGKGR